MTQDIKQRVEEILKNTPLVISQTRRAGSNGLRNADEIADKIVKELTAREEKLVADVKWFCSRVESGEVGSKRTYAKFKATLKELGIEE